MIRFTLRCDRGHGFEAWFGGNDDFDEQRGRGLVACPICDSPDVSKALMAPAIARGRSRHEVEARAREARAREKLRGQGREPADEPASGTGAPGRAAVPSPDAASPNAPTGVANGAAPDRAAPDRAIPDHAVLATGRHAALRAAMRDLAAKVRAETVDVGTRFPDEARRIHYGDAEERAIRGRATPDEARALVEEGVSIAPVPVAPDEAN